MTPTTDEPVRHGAPGSVRQREERMSEAAIDHLRQQIADHQATIRASVARERLVARVARGGPIEPAAPGRPRRLGWPRWLARARPRRAWAGS